jgi:HEPN domain-containing protein
MEQAEAVRHWTEGADEDALASAHLFQTGHYHWALFLIHLAVEKTLKARITSLGRPAPLTHDLVRLAREAGVEATTEQLGELNELTAFSIAARYDDYKRSFFQRATREFTSHWLKRGQSWLEVLRSGL